MFIKKFFIFILCLAGLGASFTFASVPERYIANYEIEEYWDEIEEIFVTIEASNKIGEEIDEEVFDDLYHYFNEVFDYFPQEYSFKVVYQQCLETTDDLSDSYNSTKLATFMDNCYSPLDDILSEIENDYTVSANIKAYPESGNAPLTVTLDARSSIDPSNETIPDDNYFWYYRDIDGDDERIGVGSVVTETFDDPGTYIIHLTVRSSNYEDDGIFDGEQDVSIYVSPKAATISVYANSQQLDENDDVKIGSYEAKKGVILDGSSTIAMGGREIMSHTWSISGPDFSYTKTSDGDPDEIKISLPNDGEYKIILQAEDNQGNTSSETYYLLVSDPVAIIKTNINEGNTSNTFTFDASTSYSVVSSLTLYTREIFDENGDKVDTIQGKTIQKEFTTPGSYIIKLTVKDALGEENTDTIQIYVESTPPIAQYSIEATNTRDKASEFKLDASLSSDVDQLNGIDSLSYSRSFSDPNFVNIIENEEDNKTITINFDKTGTHTIKLTVEDEYGQIGEIEKEIEVNSTLRPEFTISPKASPRGEYINFHASSNQEILTYEWDFGDKEDRMIQNTDITHSYTQNGIYTITLTAYGKDGQENSINDQVFIGDKDKPIAAYIVKNTSSEIMRQSDICTITNDDGSKEEINAYKVDRYQNITIDPSSSLNSEGTTTNLVYYFRPENGEFYTSSQYKHQFNEVGCQYIDLNVEDTDINQQDTQRIYFKVYNALPTLDNIILSFPQYGNELGIGFQENYIQDVFDSDYDELMVRIDASNADDDDGFISYFKWYYYNKDDPDRLLETKITPGDIDYSYFSLSQDAGEYMFGVTLYDNDEGKQSSENILGNGPVVFFASDTTQLDIPIVTLKVNKTTVTIGEEITFDIVAKVLSESKDFDSEKTIEYDFDGDGEVDLLTKNDHVTYTYKEPLEEGVTPTVSVLYKGYRGVANGAKIIVKDGFSPSILVDTFGKFSIFRDNSIGTLVEKNLCFDLISCKKGDETAIDISDNIYTSHTYTETGNYYASLYVKDQYANEGTKNIQISIDDDKNYDSIHILSIPSTNQNDSGSYETFVGKSLDNTILYYIKYDKNLGDTCYIDLDITDNSDNDFECNNLFLKEFTPKYNSLIGRIYYENSGEILNKELITSFLDFDINLDDETLEIYNKINSVINNIDDSNNNLLTLLIYLRDDIIDDNETRANVVALSEFLNTDTEYKISTEIENNIYDIIDYLSDSTTISSLGGNEYEQAKSEILLILPLNVKEEINALFNEFEKATINSGSEETTSQLEIRKEILNQILATIDQYVVDDNTEQGDNNITTTDMDEIVMPNICKIADFYEIISDQCNEEIGSGLSILNDNESSGGLSKVLKIIFSILGIVLLIFIGLIVVFAIKARKKQQET